MLTRVSDDRTTVRQTQVIVWAVIVGAVGLFVWALPAAVRFLPTAPSAFWAMALAALVVDIPLFGVVGRQDLRIRSTLSVCFIFAIFVLWGAGVAIVVQAVAAAVSAIGQRYPPQSAFFFVARLIIAVAISEAVVDIALLRPITEPGTGLTGADLLTFTALAAVWVAASYGLLAAARLAAVPGGWRRTAVDIRFDMFSTAAAVAVVAPLLKTITDWWPLLVAAPLFLWNQLSREQLRHEQQLSREPVTGLLNRQGVIGGVQAITERDRFDRHGPQPFGIVVVNFESVQEINTTLGREVYEKVVEVASRRIVEAYGDQRAGRVSGEGVVILVPDLTGDDAINAAETAVAVLEPVVEVDDVPFALDPVGGVALSPQHGRDLGTLLMKAELAALEARRTGQCAGLYVRRTAEQARRRFTLLRELRGALRDPARQGEISVLYQPQVDLATGRLTALEALLRWTHPTWGPVPPDELIEAIEPSEVMHKLTRHVLEKVAVQLRRWNEQGQQLRVSVNVSVQDLHHRYFVDELLDLIRRHGIAPDQLVVEITERMLISDMDRVSHVARTLASQAIRLSLDDFGTGYASLQQLRQLPLTEVKVDRSYISGMVDNPADRAIVTSVHQLTQALGVDVVAEGIEDQRTADELAALPGTIGQGWLFGRPMSVDDLRSWRSRQDDNGAQPEAGMKFPS